MYDTLLERINWNTTKMFEFRGENGSTFGRESRSSMLIDSQRSMPERALASAVVLLLIAFAVPHTAVAEDAAPEQLQTAASVLALNAEQAGKSLPAKIRGIVTCTTNYGLYVQDKTAGIWVESALANGRDTHWSFEPGDEVDVRGHTAPGLFSPVVSADSIRKLGRAALPHAKAVTFKELLTGNEDAQYVSITGLVRSVTLRPNTSPSQQVWLKIAMEDGTIFATLPQNDALAAGKLVDAVVRIDAAATCTKNLNRQFTSVLVDAPSIHNVTVIRPPPRDLFAAPTTAIGNLMRYRSGTGSHDRVRVTGTITYYRPGERLILEDRGRALLVMTTQISDVKPGDQVDAVGFPTPAPSGPFLADAIFRYSGEGHPATPTSVSVADLSSGTLNYNLVSIEGKLLHHISEPSGESLLLQNGSTLLRADLNDVKNANALARFRDGSIVRICGISVIDVEGSWNSGGPTASTIHFTIFLRSPDDVAEITPPSWFTAAHMFYLASVLAIMMFIFFALALYSRIEHVKLAAVLQERERLAHEIHDTLAQSFAGIGFQMQAIRRAIPNELPELRKQVDLARALVRHSHTEARRSIEPDHISTLESDDLLSTLEASGRRMVRGGLVDVRATSSGKLAYPLPAQVVDTLLHIGQEAIANAVRHADPRHIDIALAYERDFVRLMVSDDGNGFEERGDLLGFGLRGMRKRSAAISARLEIVSRPGAGTRVQVLCPLQPKYPLASFFKRTWKFISEIGPHGAREA